MSFSSSSPPPPLLSDLGGTVTGYIPSNPVPPHASSSSMNPSVLIIVLILFVTIVASISLCLLLRHLNRRCLRHVSFSSSSAATTVSDSHPLSARRVSPENLRPSVIDSLPLFTFSSITRRSSSTSSADCAVCLSKFEPNDQLRLLPLCCHAFHAQCIDAWLESNQSCPLCRSAIFASESDLLKASLASSNGTSSGGGSGRESFHLEIGNVSRRRAEGEAGEVRRSYSIGSFEYLVDEDSEVSLSHRRSVSDKEDTGASPETMEASLASEVGAGRINWLKDYIDRLSVSLSSRTMSFRSSGRFFSGSSRRSDITGAGDWDIEANRVGEEISEMFRWLSGEKN